MSDDDDPRTAQLCLELAPGVEMIMTNAGVKRFLGCDNCSDALLQMIHASVVVVSFNPLAFRLKVTPAQLDALTRGTAFTFPRVDEPGSPWYCGTVDWHRA